MTHRAHLLPMRVAKLLNAAFSSELSFQSSRLVCPVCGRLYPDSRATAHPEYSAGGEPQIMRASLLVPYVLEMDMKKKKDQITERHKNK